MNPRSVYKSILRVLAKSTARTKSSFIVGILIFVAMTSMLHGQGRLETVNRWDFGVTEDAKGDRWPDAWTRVTGIDYPKYLSIAITKRSTSPEELQEIEQMRRLYSQWALAWEMKQAPWKITPETTPREFDRWLELSVVNPYLEIQMDGGAAEILSPMTKIEQDSVYGVRCQAYSDCSSNDFDSLVTIRFFDRDKKLKFESSSRSITGVSPWQSLSTHSQYSYQEDIAWAQIALRVRPRNANSYRGKFGFDAVELIRSPRLSLTLNRPSRIYQEGEEILVECKAFGMNSSQTEIDLQIKDHEGKVAGKKTIPLTPEQISPSIGDELLGESNAVPIGKYVATDGQSNVKTKSEPKRKYWNGSCQWTLPSLPPGFYEVRTQLERTTKDRFELVQHFAVVSKKSNKMANNSLGWSFPEDKYAETLGTDDLIQLLREARIGKIKLPVWHDTLDKNASNLLVSRIDRIQAAGIACVGVIANPPPSQRANFSRSKLNDTGSVLDDTAMAQTFLEPVLQQMCVRLVNFQLGWDHEADFVNNPRFQPALEWIRRMLKRYGQEAQLIAAHNPMIAVESSRNIDRWQWTSSLAFGAEEMRTLLTRASKTQSGESVPWFHITPLPASQYSLKTRVQDLMERMLVLTDPLNQGARVAWVYDPASEETRVIRPDGGPQEMFLPFRNLAGLLAGANYVGKLPNKNFCQNAILEANGSGKMLLWTPTPKILKRYFGQKIEVHDLWGRTIPVTAATTDLGPIQSFEIGEWPVVVEGADLYAMRWQIGMELITKQVDLVVGKQEEIVVQIDNPFDFSITGRALVECSALEGESSPIPFQIGPNGQGKVGIPARINPFADTGNTPIRVVLRFDGPDNEVILAIDDLIQIGKNDIEFEVRYSIDGNNRLIVEVETINRTGKPVSFDCYVRAPGRTKEFTQISNLMERITKVFTLPDADKLVGETIWVQSKQFGESRVLNKRLTISR